MIKNIFGNIWDVYRSAKLFCVPSTNTIADGKLVLAEGYAEKIPALPKKAARIVARTIEIYNDYGFIASNTSNLGLFQTKRQSYKDANLEVIFLSCGMMAAHMAEKGIAEAHLPFPGLGEGLTEDQVYPVLIECFQGDDITVNLWQKELI